MKYTIFVLLKTFKTIYFNLFRLQNKIILSQIAQKLDDPNTSSRCYWSLLKTQLNGKKIPCIPSMFHSDKNIIDFQEKKSEIFNTFFANQCSPISNRQHSLKNQ